MPLSFHSPGVIPIKQSDHQEHKTILFERIFQVFHCYVLIKINLRGKGNELFKKQMKQKYFRATASKCYRQFEL